MKLRPLNPKRDYAIDLLRILSMLMIIFYHILHHPNLLPTRVRFTPGYDIVLFTQLCLMCAVNIYALISGYVGYGSRPRYSRLAELWLTVLCYSAGIALLYFLFRPGSVSASELWKYFLPSLNHKYWFFSAYFILFLFRPLLHSAVDHLSRRRLKFVLISLLVFIGIISTIYTDLTGTDSYGVNRGFSAWWMMVLYLVGAYIRKYDPFAKTKRWRFLLAFFLTAAVSTALKLLVQYYAIRKMHNVRYYNSMFINYNSINLWIGALCLFFFFRGLKLKPLISRVVAFLTPMTFSVYLIHDHPLIRARIFKTAFLPLSKLPTPLMLLSALGISVAIYLLCSAIDYLRVLLFRLLRIRKLFDSLESKAIVKLKRT